MLEPRCHALFCTRFRTASAECCLRQTVLREAREETLERTLPNLVEDFCSPFLRQDRVAVHWQDVVDAANSQTSP